VLWPAFGILGLYFWWMLIHTDYDNVGLKGMLRQQANEDAEAGVAAPVADAPAPAASPVDDPELAAYNARLAELADQGPKTWRARESVVVRREQ
jgi:hypothetical protein